MRNRFPVFIVLAAMVISISFVIMPVSASATIADGTYELNYEMKEAQSENTSIADGYFTKPAILTVKDGIAYLQMTVTGSNYVKSLTAPSGPVEVISEDTENHVVTVKFKVDGDLSEPLNMEMHIIVPDLYDMVHTARAVFDVSGLNYTEPGEKSNKDDEAQDAVNTEKAEETNQPEETTTAESNKDDEAEVSSETVEDESSPVVFDAKEEDTQKEESSSSTLLITLAILAVLIAGFIVWKLRSNKNK